MTSARLQNTAYPSDQHGHLIADRYRTLDQIGTGRLGKIYAATDERMEEIGVEQQVAIQVVAESVVRNNRLFNRLNLGYSQLRDSSHPNIVEFVRFGRDGKSGYLVMKMLDGASLRTVLDDAKTLPLTEMRPVLHSIGAALRFLHSKDIFHGNLITQNVFVTGDLEVRLLDVLPADPTEALFRANAPGKPQKRYSVEDDVFGLACLAYEMLSGFHPFDGKYRAEAKMAGREAERIGSLPDREWQALRLTLSLNDESPKPSVAEFLRAFGALNAERLQPANQPSPMQEAPSPIPTIPPRPAEVQPTLVVATNTTGNPVSAIERRTSHPKREKKEGHSLRAVFLGMVLAWLGAWTYYGELEEHMVSLIGYLDERIGINFVDLIEPSQTIETSDVFVDLPAVEPDPIALTESVVTENAVADSVETIDAPYTAAPDVVVETMAAVATEGEITTDVSDDETIDEKRITDEPISEELVAEELVARDAIDQQSMSEETIGEERIVGEEIVVEGEQLVAETAAGQVPTESELAIAEFVVSVSEGDGAARITAPRIDGSGASLIWWTSEYSATGDVDYVSIAQKPLTGASLDEDGILYVPLVNDGIMEQRESFFVNIGRIDTRQGQIERIAAIRVDILDDDWS